MTDSEPHFPFQLIEHDEEYSLVCSDFHLFYELFGEQECGGYTIEKLAKVLVKEHRIKGVKFDSEAGMFCAFSNRRESIEQLCGKLRDLTGPQQRDRLSGVQENTRSIPLDEAERLLLTGFVTSLDPLSQETFLKCVPCPTLTQGQAECIRHVQNGTPEEKISGAKKINAEARTLNRDWDHYLSHPSITQILMDCCDSNQESVAVYQELVWALVFICERHLPDLRLKPYFLEALNNKIALMRWLGIMGLYGLGQLTPELVTPLLTDRSAKVREVAKEHLGWIQDSKLTYPFWLFKFTGEGQGSD